MSPTMQGLPRHIQTLDQLGALILLEPACLGTQLTDPERVNLFRTASVKIISI